MKEPRVKEILRAYEKRNIEGVKTYFKQSDMVIDPSTWAGKLNETLENKQYETAKEIIELTIYKFIKL